ncbi:hypothetical protein C5167_002552 [Papaver somniferum]|uniref:Uncharacterized protein n=1 Tax=Papaver somniferum TaxID=3469 RepID=A0A4Y7KZL8_PAPSO|nr:titin homolog [Papaver somniferum]XP_026414218.1 titin homolog [Papaver somniferum]RZC78356.1 hypothetical protein C5167_002552 [Papaver somniferum]
MGMIHLVIRLWKCTIFSVVTCYRSARDHPLVSLMVIILYLLYTFLPSVFGFLVSSSPIVVCTVVLLGALLNIGYPQTPEFKPKSSATINVPSLEDDKKEQVVENVDVHETAGVLPTKEDAAIDNRSVLVEEKPKLIHPPKPPLQKDREFHNMGFSRKRDTQHANQHNEGASNSSSTKVLKKMKKMKMKGLKVDVQKPVPNNPLKEWLKDPSRLHRNDENAESSDFGSDQAQCASPLDSIADIIPVLDELHPLLDFKPLHTNLESIEESDAASEWSGQSNDGSLESEVSESEDGSENQEVEDEEALESEDERVKSVVTWTEDDENNLKDLGTSELERNQWLENLVAKRRARKTLSMDIDRDLIDLESIEPPTQIPPVVTTRNNPFEYYTNETGETQPVPSSAPSVLLPRRNPFDLPFDPFDERSNLNGDNYQQDVTPVHLDKDMSFCRNQSFTLGSTFGSHAGRDKREINLISFLANEERMGSEGTRDPVLQRSESKLSCVHETDTAYSGSDEEAELSPKSKLVSEIGHSPDLAEHLSQTSEDIDSVEVEQEDKKDVYSSKAEINRVDSHSKIESDSKSCPSSPSSASEVNEKGLHEHTNAEKESKNEDKVTKGESVEEGNSEFLGPSLSQIETEVKSKAMEQHDETQVQEPIFDSSPSAATEIHFEDVFEDALLSQDKGMENSKIGEKAGMPTEEKPLGSESNRNEDSHSNELVKEEASSHQSEAEENVSRPRELTEASEQNLKEVGVSEAKESVDEASNSKASVVEESSAAETVEANDNVAETTAASAEPTSSESERVADGPSNEAPASSINQEINAGVQIPNVKEEEQQNGTSDSSLSAAKEMPNSVEQQAVQISSNGVHKEPEEVSVVDEKKPKEEEAKTIDSRAKDGNDQNLDDKELFYDMPEL